MAENEIVESSEKVEKKDQGDRTSENTSRDAVIGGDRQDHQKIHEKASKAGHTFDTFSDNDDDQSFKAIQPAVDSFGIDFGGYVETSKGLVTKPSVQDKGQEILEAAQALKPSSPDSIPLGGQNYRPDQLIAANMTPNNSVVSDAANYSEPDTVPDKETDTKISQGLPTDVHTPFESGEVLRPAIEAAGEVGKVVTEKAIDDFMENVDGPVFPYRGLEDFKLAECSKENPSAWEDAFAALPTLKEVGLTPDHLRAVVRNELHWYDFLDVGSDNESKKGNPQENTLGPTQITPKGIREFNRAVPEFKKFLDDKGFKVPGDEQKILEDPSCVPMITAAKMASMIKIYQAHNQNHPDQPVDINPKSLIYGYNADVQRLNQNGRMTYESMTDLEAASKQKLGYNLEKVHPSSDPDVLNTSKHLRRVLNQLEIVRKSH